ncbi:glycoside hydrolase [Aliifodinibius salipaludis]|uniref:Glycoside hydrolase n=1 Tax=Fodinibius salipaludis TaxID=2032627 RepID=A0A2A2GFX3_9BACT|nr:glycosyltransferase family 4 protein [Aliifodinibius salipaludis]PAU95672.1 glycoside hydrolase [Aliifodinibius salipaludis]
MNLLFITQDFPPKTGGIETYSFELAKRFQNRVDKFGVVAPSHPHASGTDSEMPFEVVRVPIKDSLLPVAAPITLLSLIGNRLIDTVLHAQWQTAIASVITRKLIGYPKKIYVSAHARELLIEPFAGQGGFLSKQLHALRRKLLSQIDGFFPVSRYTAKLLEKEGVRKDNIRVVENGTNPLFFTPKNANALAKKLEVENKKIIFSVCRLVPRKGMDVVLKALKEIVQQDPNVIYLLGGSGPDASRLKALCNNLGLKDHVKFLGRIAEQELPYYYSLADVFVMPAKNNPPDVEGFGIVFLEANACGTPVIGSKTGGIPDAIVDGETGLLVDENNIEELKIAISKLITNTDLAHKMGEAGRKRILSEINWDTSAQRILNGMV